MAAPNILKERRLQERIAEIGDYAFDAATAALVRSRGFDTLLLSRIDVGDLARIEGVGDDLAVWIALSPDAAGHPVSMRGRSRG